MAKSVFKLSTRVGENFETISFNAVQNDYLQEDIDDNQWHLIGFPFSSDSQILGQDIFGEEQTYNSNGEPTNWAIYRYSTGDHIFDEQQEIWMESPAYLLYTIRYLLFVLFSKAVSSAKK